MALSFDVSNAAGVGKLNDFLASRSYISGYSVSQADVTVFNALKGAPSASAAPHVARWYKHIASWSLDARKLFPTAGAAVKVAAASGAAAPAAAAPAAAAKKDDDMDDLFDSDSEDEEAGEIRRKKIVEEHRARLAAAGKPKKVVVAKSIITFDVKPWDDTTDMDALTKACKAIEMDGLVWGSHQLIPVAFGVKKLSITCVVEDDKVSTQDLEEKISEFEDYVQSVDIASFQKV